MNHLYLPKRKEKDGAGGLSPVSGYWKSDTTPGILETISQEIIVNEKLVEGRVISSIPSVWARPLLFRQALVDPKHPIHLEVHNEWRALLSLLALRTIRPELGVSLREVALSEFNETFSLALQNLAPSPLKFLEDNSSVGFDKIVLIYIKHVCVGALSPYSLVYSSEGYSSHLRRENVVNEFIDDNFKLSYSSEKVKDKDEIAEWIEKHLTKTVFTKLKAKQPDLIAQNVIKETLRLFTEWKVENGRTEGSDAKDVDHVDPGTEIYIGANDVLATINFDNNFLYKSLLTPMVECDSHDNYESSALKLLSHGQSKRIIVITKELLEKDRVVYDKKTSSNLFSILSDSKQILDSQFCGARGTSIKGKELHNAEWIRPELLFFTDKIYFSEELLSSFNTSNMLPCAGKYLVPLKKEFLQFFKITQAYEWKKFSFSIEEQQDGSVKVSFNLTVGENVATQEIVSITKVYKSDSVVRLEKAIISIFPVKPSQEWRHYSLFEFHDTSLEVKPIYSNPCSSICKVVDLVEDKKADNLEFVPRITSIIGDNAYPDALSLCKGSFELGLIPLFEPEHDRSGNTDSGRTLCYGVDFGTSNTNVYYGNNIDGDIYDEDVVRFDFKTLHACLVSNFEVNESEKIKTILRTYFVPHEKIELPISTALRRNSLTTNDKSLLSCYFPYFASYGLGLHRNVVVNLKWDTENSGDNSAGKSKREEYFEGLLYLLLIDAALKNGDSGSKKIHFTFSFPKVFNNSAITSFKESWEKAMKSLLDSQRIIGVDSQKRYFNINGRAQNDNSTSSYFKHTNDQYNSKQSDLFSEGFIGGLYYQETSKNDTHNQFNPFSGVDGHLFIGIDIGGGTTDITYWANKGPQYEFSALFAGSNITKIFQKGAKLRNTFFVEPRIRTLLELFASKNEKMFAQLLNVAFRHYEDKGLTSEILKSSCSTEEMHKLRSLFCLVFGAVPYYSGMVASSVEKLSGERKLRDVTLAFGGNGSKFIKWIESGDTITESSHTYKLFQNLFEHSAKASGLEVAEKAVRCIFSETPKAESALGLVLRHQTKNLPKERFKPGTTEDKSSMNFDLGLDSNIGFGLDTNTEFGGDFSSVIDQTIMSKEQLEEKIVLGDEFKDSTGKIFKANDRVMGSDVLDKNGCSNVKKLSFVRLAHFVKILNYIGVQSKLFDISAQIVLTPELLQTVEKNVLLHYDSIANMQEEEKTIEPLFLVEIRSLFELLAGQVK